MKYFLWLISCAFCTVVVAVDSTPVDISEAWKHPECRDYHFGHHPSNRLELTIGRYLVFESAPAAAPFNYLAYPVLQFGSRTVDVVHKFSFKRLPD